MSALLAPAFDAGFVLDAIEEPTFPEEDAGGATPLSWNGNFSDIPPVLVARLKPKAG